MEKKSRRSWTSDDLVALIALVESRGVAVAAEAFGVSISNVAQRIFQFNKKLPKGVARIKPYKPARIDIVAVLEKARNKPQ